MKIGLRACLPNMPLRQNSFYQNNCKPNRALTFDLTLTRSGWPETFGSTINWTKDHWFDPRNKLDPKRNWTCKNSIIFLSKEIKTQKKQRIQRTLMNIQTNSSNMNYNLDQISWNKKHRKVGNHLRIKN